MPSKKSNESTSVFKWIGSFFLWFLTPTYASGLWSKWIDRTGEEKPPEKSDEKSTNSEHTKTKK